MEESWVHKGEKAGGDAALEAVLDRYEDLKVADKELDQHFVWPEETRPEIRNDEFDLEVPIIDLTPVFKLKKLRKEAADGVDPKGMEEEIRACEAEQVELVWELISACETYGFFQLINHGFPLDLVHEFKESYREIFDMPLEEKLKVEEEFYDNKLGKPGYTPLMRSNVYTKFNKSHVWNEGFVMESPETRFPGRLEQLSKILYPEGSENSEKGVKLRSRAEEYGKRSSDLSRLLLDLMAEGLGLPEDAVCGLLGGGVDTQIRSRLRVNHFPVCPRPDLTWGIFSHTDANVLTVLYQDAIGGLQICLRDGTWHGVRPVPGAFVVNVADFLQAWTNGRFVSAQHRVVANDKCRRFSIAYFAIGSTESISPRAELVDAEHPLLYKPLTREKYYELVMARGLAKTRGQILTNDFAADSKK